MATTEPDAAASTAEPDTEPQPRPSASSRWTMPAAPRRGVLVVPALLVVALALLVVGLVTSSSGWLAASLVASVLAAVLLVVERLVQRRRSAGVADGPSDPTPAPAAPVDLDTPPIDPDDPEAVWVVDGRPRYHRRDCATLTSLTPEPVSRTQAVEDGFVPCSLCSPEPPPADGPRHAV